MVRMERFRTRTGGAAIVLTAYASLTFVENLGGWRLPRGLARLVLAGEDGLGDCVSTSPEGFVLLPHGWTRFRLVWRSTASEQDYECPQQLKALSMTSVHTAQASRRLIFNGFSEDQAHET